MENKSCLKNGKFTGLVILLALLFAMITFIVGVFLVTYYHDTRDDSFKDPIGKLIYASGSGILINGASAMVNRGGNFVREIGKRSK